MDGPDGICRQANRLPSFVERAIPSRVDGIESADDIEADLAELFAGVADLDAISDRALGLA